MSSLVAAGTSSASSSSSGLLIFALPLLLIGFMFFTQRRRTRESQRLQAGLGLGDEVMTTSGLLGTITALDDTVATLEVSPGVSIRFSRRAIAGPAPVASGSNVSETDGPSDPEHLTD